MEYHQRLQIQQVSEAPNISPSRSRPPPLTQQAPGHATQEARDAKAFQGAPQVLHRGWGEGGLTPQQDHRLLAARHNLNALTHCGG